MKARALRIMGVEFEAKPEMDRLMVVLPNLEEQREVRYLDRAEVKCLRDFLNDVLES